MKGSRSLSLSKFSKFSDFSATEHFAMSTATPLLDPPGGSPLTLGATLADMFCCEQSYYCTKWTTPSTILRRVPTIIRCFIITPQMYRLDVQLYCETRPFHRTRRYLTLMKKLSQLISMYENLFYMLLHQNC